jgi:2-polyprenyl-3-methyl-5-hydroxy-6-metoxy-1,4-benzoquinol methylase
MKKLRTHDELYLKSNRYKKPKESFKLLGKILSKRLNKKNYYNLLDIGCANGELLYFLNEKFNNLNLTGVDIRGDLIGLAKKKLPSSINLIKKDFNKKQKLTKKYDIIIISGVISIFDRLDIIIQNIKKSCKKNYLIFFCGPFNEYNFDTLIAYKDLNSKIKTFQSGWNVWSIKTLQSFFKQKIKRHPFNFKLNLKKNKKDLMRSWTIKVDKKRYFTNALPILQNHMWLEIKK